jgi:signal transduction histidine kinase/ligand-binding sensor domain-containing protein
LLCLLAHQYARAADVPSDKYSVTSWTDQEGLPLSQIWALTQTSDGFLWLATTAGLVRFDGQTFRLGVPGLPEGEVTTVRASRDGSLWVALNDGRVSRLNFDGTLKTFGPGDGLTAGRVTELLEDRQGTVWAGAPGGLFRFRDGKWAAVGAVGAVNSLYEDRHGNLLVGSTRLGAMMLEANTDQLKELGTSRTTVNSFSEDPSGGLWANDGDQGYRLLRGPTTSSLPPTGLKGEVGYRLLHDGNGDMWIATSFEGLVRVRGSSADKAPTVERFMTTEGLAHNLIRSLLQDRDGNIWIGTLAGLSRVSKSVFASVRAPIGTGSVNSLSVGYEGRLWVATTEGLLLNANGRQKVFRETDGLPSNYVTVVEEDARGVLWAGTARGLARLDGDRFRTISLPDGSSAGFVRTLTAGTDGSIWFWGADLGLTRLREGQFTEVPTPTADRGYLALRDAKGSLWFSLTNNSGFVRWADGTIRRYSADDGLGSGRVNSITESNGVVWSATNVGLSRLDGDRFVTLPRNRLPGTPMSVVVDGEDHLWLGTGSGFVRLSVSEFNQAVSDPSYNPRFSLYDAADGAPGPPVYTIGRGSVRAEDGRIWFATRNGLAVVQPSELPVRRLAPAVRIETLVTDQNTPVRIAGAGQLSRPTRIQLDYAALSLSSPWVRFRYMLDGFDATWIDAGTNRQAVYTNLRPGDYRFRVAAANKDGLWSEPAVWNFSVSPAFYETQWFLAVAVVVMGLLVWAAWQLRLRSVHHRLALVFAERTRVAREIHDTLLQSLVGVAWRLDTIREAPADESPGEMRLQVAKLRTEMEGFIREARESIWNLRSTTLAEHDLPAALEETGRRLTAGSSMQFDLVVSGTPRRVSARVEQQLLRIGQEAVTNAVRHAHASVVRMEVCYTDDSVFLRVSDDGRGFDPSSIVSSETNHWGLKSMEERMLEIGGRLSLVSRVGEGTTLEAKAPLSTAA